MITDLLSSKMKLNRSLRLREAESPEEIKEVMTEVVSSALIAQTGGTKKMQQRAIEEMKQIRQDMVTKNISTKSKNQKKYLGKLTGLIDNLESIEEQNDDTGSAFSKLKDSLPSTDTLISGIMTANPILGYGIKGARDLFKGFSESKKKKKNKEQERLKYLQEVQQKLMGGLDEEIQREIQEEEGGAGSVSSPMIEGYKDILESINEEIKSLRKTIEFNGSSSLETVNENIEASNITQQKILDIEKDRAEDQELQGILRRREEEATGGLAGEKDSATGGFTFFGALPEKLKGVLMGIGNFFKRIAVWGAGLAVLGGAKALGGIKTVVSGIAKGFTAIAGLTKHAGKLLKVAGKATLIGTVIMSIWDFINGFINAGDFLGIEDVNIGDRIVAGYLKVTDSLMEIVDWVANLFGFEEVFGEERREKIKNTIFGFYNKAVDWVSGVIENIADFFKDFSLTDSVSDLTSWASDTISNLWEKIKEKITGLIDDAWNFLKDTPGKIVEGGKELVDDTIKSGKETLDDVGNFFFGEDQPVKMKPINGIISGEFQSDNPSNIFAQTMRTVERMDREKKDSGNGKNFIANSDNRVINNTRIHNGDKSSSNSETSMKNARFMRSLKFTDN